MEEREAGEQVAEVELALAQLDALADPAAQALATAAVQAVVELYGEGLRRLLAGAGEPVARAVAGDELVAHLLLLHGLHPVTVEERVRDALVGVRPYLESHGGDVELVAVQEGVVRLRMQGSCEGCPASAMTLKLAIEKAILDAAPDVDRVEADGGGTPAAGLLQIEAIPTSAGAPATRPPAVAWASVGALPQLRQGGTLLKEVAGEALLFLQLDGTSYAYRARCPGCEGSLEDAALEGAELSCPTCGNHYDARRAGRCLDAPQLQLDPVPLLVDDAGLVKVAAGVGVG
ncbi:MAG: nitrogen-fixing NifU domain protein [Conexibacter sp.]|nr:nitrogen-fixing NifU domain protein [Conexibacter sp.]